MQDKLDCVLFWEREDMKGRGDQTTKIDYENEGANEHDIVWSNTLFYVKYTAAIEVQKVSSAWIRLLCELIEISPLLHVPTRTAKWRSLRTI